VAGLLGVLRAEDPERLDRGGRLWENGELWAWLSQQGEVTGSLRNILTSLIERVGRRAKLGTFGLRYALAPEDPLEIPGAATIGLAQDFRQWLGSLFDKGRFALLRPLVDDGRFGEWIRAIDGPFGNKGMAPVQTEVTATGLGDRRLEDYILLWRLAPQAPLPYGATAVASPQELADRIDASDDLISKILQRASYSRAGRSY